MENSNSQNSSTEIAKRQETNRRRAFNLIIEIAFVLAIPAFIGAFAGIHLDESQGTGRRYSLIFSAVAFLISWIIIIRKYILYNRQIKKTEKEIKDLKEKTSDQNSTN